jgi:hypothetical protein
MKKTYGFTFLAVVLGTGFMMGPQTGTIVNESASAPVVIHVAHSMGGVLG